MVNFDPTRLAAEFYEDPYPTYRALRETSPIHPVSNGYFLTRYADVRAVYRDPKAFSSDKRTQFAPIMGAGSPLFEHHTTSLVFNDPPLHTQVRRAIGNALSPAIVTTMQGELESIVTDLLQALPARADLVADYAAAIPIEIIGNLLRIPQADRDPLRYWSLAILGALEASPPVDVLTTGNQAVLDFLDYLEGLVEERSATLKDTDDDIMARLLRWEEAGVQLKAEALYHQCIFLLNAGHETTTNLIANAIELMQRLPQVRAELLHEPYLIDGMIEEVLRFESPNQLGNRTVVETTEYNDVTLPAGCVLTLCIGGANRDPDVFSDPETFDMRRQPNPHLAFGAGIHTCAGLHVARLEARIAIGQLLHLYPDFELDMNGCRRPQRARFRGWQQLPARLY